MRLLEQRDPPASFGDGFDEWYGTHVASVEGEKVHVASGSQVGNDEAGVNRRSKDQNETAGAAVELLSPRLL